MAQYDGYIPILKETYMKGKKPLRKVKLGWKDIIKVGLKYCGV
jgi:hypothetical protein